MKTLVVYFSLSGHTHQVASEIATRCGADLEAIQEYQGRSGAWGYLRSGWQAMRRAAPPIKPAVRDPGGYDLVIATFVVTEKQLPERAHSEPLRNFVSRLAAG